VHFASRHPEIFSSVRGILMTDTPPALAEQLGSMIVLDDPRHQRLRAIVSRAFTPKVLARAAESVRDRAHRLVSAMVADHPDGRGDLVADLAGPLPLQVICDMMGIPEEDHDKIFQWTNAILGYGDPDLYADYGDFAKATQDAAITPMRSPRTGAAAAGMT
jgi:cytochrome P450